eukprot:CAMPEP_0172662398 /NCGR_PEP_ID=MMETSP1074-20121228/5341_1 /TAXON_ID=2916 /ORGANISM="Ceratium fusus, Strain PA161109" /LENGTH=85 /DNA_ID=CAMNT_0013478309 /DNA_START=813 /DNA_END=1070 /DNA_ORIENTATION=-
MGVRSCQLKGAIMGSTQVTTRGSSLDNSKGSTLQGLLSKASIRCNTRHNSQGNTLGAFSPAWWGMASSVGTPICSTSSLPILGRT